MSAILRDLALLMPTSRDDGRRIFLLGAFLFYAVEQLLRYRKHLAFSEGIPQAFRAQSPF